MTLWRVVYRWAPVTFMLSRTSHIQLVCNGAEDGVLWSADLTRVVAYVDWWYACQCIIALDVIQPTMSTEIHCVPKKSTFLIFKCLCQKVTDFNDFWYVKSWANSTSMACTFPTSPVYCSRLTLGNPKSHFSTVLSIHPSDYLRYLRRKQTVTPLPTIPENITTLPCRCTIRISKKHKQQQQR